jgi:hypothetical protein
MTRVRPRKRASVNRSRVRKAVPWAQAKLAKDAGAAGAADVAAAATASAMARRRSAPAKAGPNRNCMLVRISRR